MMPLPEQLFILVQANDVDRVCCKGFLQPDTGTVMISRTSNGVSVATTEERSMLRSSG